MSQKYEQIINYGLQKKKSKQEIIAALVKENELNNAGAYIKQLDELGTFGGESPETKEKEKASSQLYDSLDVVNQLSGKISSNQGFEGAVGSGWQKFLPGWAKPGEGQFIAGTEPSNVEALHNQIIGKLKLEAREKLKGTGQISDAEQKMLGEAVAALNMDSSEDEYKIQLGKIKNILTKAYARAGGSEVLQSTTETPEQIADRMNKAVEFAKANPEDEKAKKFMEDWNNNRFDLMTGKLKDEFKVLTPYEQKLKEQGLLNTTQTVKTQQAAQMGSETEQKTDTIGLLGKVGEKLGSFFGGNKIGAALGDRIGATLAEHGEAGDVFKNTIAGIEKAFREGKIDENKRKELLDMQEKAAKDAFGYAGPSFTQVAADVARSVLSVAGGAELRGATLAGTAAKTALWGAGQGFLNATAEGENLKETAKQAGIGALVMGSVPVAGKLLGKSFKAIIGRNTPAEAIGEILQGETKDLKPGQRILSLLDPKEVKTFADIKQGTDEIIETLSQKVDEILGKDATIVPLDKLVTVAKTKSGQAIKTNTIKRAFDHLQELYAKTGDDVALADIQDLFKKASTQGLTKSEVNKVAREYGINFGDKAFNKIGDPLTSVNAQLYENTRKGLKNLARVGTDGSKAKELDSLMSDAFRVRDLMKKNIEGVNKLEQRAVKMGIGEKIVRQLTNVADVVSLGATSGARKFFVPSNVGNKTLNYMGIEERLTTNLKIIQAAEKANTPGQLETILKQLNRKAVDKVKRLRPGLNAKSTTPGPYKITLDDGTVLKHITKEDAKDWTAYMQSKGKKYNLENIGMPKKSDSK